MPRPYVAISRVAEVDAAPAARAIAAQLGYTPVDEELVDEIAREAKVPRDVVQTYDLNPHDQLEQMIADLPFMKMFSEDEYVRHLTRVVKRFAAVGRVVLVGHAASQVLKEGPGVRVHLTAPLELRARWRALREGIEQDDARRLVEAEDGRRQKFCERHFGHAPDSPHATDLIIDVLATDAAQIADRVSRVLNDRLEAIRAAQPPTLAETMRRLALSVRGMRGRNI